MATDTQWPRWEVFKQDTPKKVHQAVGSVHAPDAETALLEARNVFVRRPKAVSLWLVSAESILARTRQQIEAGLPEPDAAEAQRAPQTFHIFRKTTQRRSMTFVDHDGTLEAPSALAALRLALATLPDAAETWVWWIVSESAIVRSADEDAESWFEPAEDKRYRHQSAYGFVGPRRKKRT